MTIEELGQLYYLIREIEMCNNRLNELASINSSSEIEDELAHIISDRLKRCIDQKNRLEQYIVKIDDDYTRQIFILRFVAALPWRDVAEGVGINSACARMICRRYILAHQ